MGEMDDGDGEWESICAPDQASGPDQDKPTRTTIVLVGRTGNGKSATGNSILGTSDFKSGKRHKSVTQTCQLGMVVREDAGRRCVSVVDTPGLFDPSMSPESLQNGISQCIKLTPEGIHALVMVLSARSRFTTEELSAVDSIETIFGERVADYLIVLFTGGDELEDDGTTLEEYLKADGDDDFDCLSNFLKRCRNRVVLFDNKTLDKAKKELQVQRLLELVDEVVAANGGKPYSSELFIEMQHLAAARQRDELLRQQKPQKPHSMSEEEFQKQIECLKREIEQNSAERMKIFQDMIESKIKLAAEKQQKMLEEKLAAAEAARQEEQVIALKAKQAADADIERLTEELVKLREQRKAMEEKIEREINSKRCTIL